MDFALSDEQTAIFDMAHAFGQENIAPHARAREAAGTIPKELWPEIGALGFGGLYVSEESGGSGLSRLDATLVFEALSMACPSVAAFLSIHNMCARMIDAFGSDELKARVLPGVISMETVLSYCLTEPGSGSDAAALKTRAERSNDGYVLNGTKSFISGGNYSDAYVCMVRTGDAGPKGVSTVYVETGTEGLSFGAFENKMGWRSQPTAQVQFDDCKVPAANLVGVEGDGFKYAMMGLDGGRLNIAACSLGAAQAGLMQTLAYMGERKAFGQSIDQFQGLQWRLADMEIELQAARTFLRQAAWKLDNKAPDATKFCAMAKKFVTEAGSRIVNQCLQLHGGYGYLSDYGIEKLVRDLRVHEILEGTNEIMRVIVARHMLAARMSDIDIRVTGRAGRITFTRPAALNAMTYEMCMAIDAAMRAWVEDDRVQIVVIDAEGAKAFCAGGDIAELYATGRAGDFAYGRRFWRDEYRLNALIYGYPKPVVSFMQGFTMGGGVGIGCHAGMRVVDDGSRISMPECGIGLVPDVGGTLVLAEAPGRIGEYLGLTAHRMTPGDAVIANFADYLIPREEWPGLIAALERDANEDIVTHSAGRPAVLGLADLQNQIDRHFSAPTLEAIRESLAADDSDFAKGALAAMSRNAPLSMACTLEILRRLRAEGPTIRGALTLEYRFTWRAMEHGDFLEGIRAQIIDKDRNPQWQYADTAVPQEAVEAMLAPLGGDELTFE